MKAPAFIQTTSPAPAKSLKPLSRLFIGLQANAKFALLQRTAAPLARPTAIPGAPVAVVLETRLGAISDFGFWGCLAPIF